MSDVLDRISRIGIVPVIRIDNLEDAAPLASALCEGGLPVAEVTFRTDLAKDAMIIMKKERPDMLLGAGTVLTKQQVDDAIGAGAEFIVSPGLNPEIVAYCLEKKIPIVPGTANPSDIETALSFGLDTVKFFPAEQLGGVKMIKALAAPYVNVKFMPTGGVKENNICEYLAFDKIIACGGTWMIDQKLIKEKKYDQIRELTRSAVKTMLGLKLDHVGVNADEDTALDTAKEFAGLLNMEVREGNSSVFAGDTIEVVKKAKGTHGHLCYSCNSVDRAVRYFESQGHRFLPETAKYDEKGHLTVIYFEKEINGFMIHLKKR